MARGNNSEGGKRGRKAREESVRLVYSDENFLVERELRNWILTDKTTKQVGYFGSLPALFNRVADLKVAETTYSDVPSITAAFNNLMSFNENMMKQIDVNVKKQEAGLITCEEPV